MRLSDLKQPLSATLIGDDLAFSTVDIDTRQLAPGSLYVAIRGERFDGHDFIEEAAAQGAVAAIVSQSVKTNLPLLKVSSTRLALGQLATWYRNQFSIPFIGHTGSNGKTTTKEMMAAILENMGPVLATQGNFNNDIGVPLTLLRLKPEHQYAVCELGSNHQGEIPYTASLVQPQVGLITNIAAAHIGHFGDLEGVLREKTSLYRSLPADGIGIVNADDEYTDRLREALGERRYLTFGIKNPADFSAKAIEFDPQGIARFQLVCPLGETIIQLTVPGEHNVLNALAAAATTYAVGADLEAIEKGLSSMSSVKGRLCLCQGKAGARVIDDTYNANPHSVLAALRYLTRLEGERVLVLGDMAELGVDAKYYHRQIGESAKTLGLHQVYTCGDLSALTAEAFGTGAQHFSTQQALIEHLQKESNEHKVYLVKGSRSSAMEKVVTALMQ